MKSEKLIMVVEREILLGDESFQGFKPQNQIDYESRILDNFKYMKRGLAEEDPTHKQPVGYAMIVNPTLKQIFAYQRSTKDDNYAEKRLQGKWSWGVGGHIEKFDVENGNPLHASMLRELEEEVSVNGSVNPKVLGYINDDSNDVGKVHFGVLYVVETNSRIVTPKDSEIDNGRLRTIDELEEICSSPDFAVEEWSRISLEPLKRYFSDF
ncbi:MAG: NUDIX domain-containing protein [Candidatus Heimdallarchaeaceae archaeon]